MPLIMTGWGGGVTDEEGRAVDQRGRSETAEVKKGWMRRIWRLPPHAEAQTHQQVYIIKDSTAHVFVC